MKRLMKWVLLSLLFVVGGNVAYSETTQVTLTNTDNTTGNPIVQAEIQVFDVTKSVGEEDTAQTLLSKATGTPIAVLTTDENGQCFIALENGSYLFVQKEKAGRIELIQPVLLRLPVYSELGEILKNVTITPKNYLTNYAPYFYKHGYDFINEKDLGPLSGAVFILSKKEGSQSVYLKSTENSSIQWTSEFRNTATQKDTASIDELIGSKKNFNPNLSYFISGEDGKVTTGDYRLPAGEYTFIEVETVATHVLSEGAEVKVSIPTDVTKQILVTTTDTNQNTKTTTEENSIFYNTDKTTLPLTGEPQTPETTKTPETSKIPKTPKTSRKLPNTGEKRSKVLFGLGCFILIGAVAVKKRRAVGKS